LSIGLNEGGFMINFIGECLMIWLKSFIGGFITFGFLIGLWMIYYWWSDKKGNPEEENEEGFTVQ
jgi:hypothetical protein